MTFIPTQAIIIQRFIRAVSFDAEAVDKAPPDVDKAADIASKFRSNMLNKAGMLKVIAITRTGSRAWHVVLAQVLT